MSQWILDTDHVSLLLSGEPKVIEQAMQRHPNVAITIVTVQELYNGWVGKLNRNSDPDALVRLYAKLSKTLDFIKLVTVLNFDESAKTQYIALQQQSKVLARRRIEKDVRIAAIALSKNAIMVTRNQKDFELIPNLQIENWTAPENQKS
ncbi:MAG: type II toxin-antitoxin system VapC family toxin [Cyanobacteria bacterium J06555_13]